MKPTKTQLEITKLEKQIAKLHGDLAQKRRLEALRAEADALQEAIKAESCDKPHYPAPCPLPHSPFLISPWHGYHAGCQCSQCKPFYPRVTNPIITCTDGLGNVTTVTPSNTGTIYGDCSGASAGTVSVFSANSDSGFSASAGGLLNTGTQMGADGVPFTYTAGTIGERLMITPTIHNPAPFNLPRPDTYDYDPYMNKLES
jgi:hypothetical protein